MGGIQPDGCQHRHHFPKKIILHPCLDRRTPLRAADKADARPRQPRQHLVIQQRVLPVNNPPRLRRNQAKNLLWCFAVGGARGGTEFDLLLQSGHTDFKKFIHVGRHDRQEFQPLQQWHGAVFRLRQHAPVEGKHLQFAVQKPRGGFGGCQVRTCFGFFARRCHLSSVQSPDLQFTHWRRQLSVRYFRCCRRHPPHVCHSLRHSP